MFVFCLFVVGVCFCFFWIVCMFLYLSSPVWMASLLKKTLYLLILKLRKLHFCMHLMLLLFSKQRRMPHHFFFYYYYYFTSFRCLGFRILRFCSFTFAKVLYSGFTAASKKVQVAMAIPISMAMHHTARHRGVSVDAEHEAQTLWDC